MATEMQLFILGPAFNLPSIDAECNAAVALLQHWARDRYEIIPTHRDAGRLPFLVYDNVKVHGFSSIVRYLRSDHISDEHTRHDSRKRGQAVALTAFIESQAPLLLDISLYVSFENYRHATRPAFTRFLPWHTNYIFPPQRRSAARKRTEHLGISSIDVDDVHEDLSDKPPGMVDATKENAWGEDTQKRASLLLPRRDTLRSLLQRPEHAAVFKLHAVADAFFAPLEEMLQESDDGKEGKEVAWLLGLAEPTTVDFLLFGYLSLMLYPEVPQAWLSMTLRRKYQRLVAYTEKLSQILEFETDTKLVLELISTGVTPDEGPRIRLPFRPAVRPSLTERVWDIQSALLDSIPFLDSSSSLQLLHMPGGVSWHHQQRQYLIAIVASTISAVAVLGFIAHRQRWTIWPTGEGRHVFAARRQYVAPNLSFLGDALFGVDLLRGGGPTGR